MQDIGRRLYEKHQTYFADYTQSPEHLVDVLAEEFGPSHKTLVEKINQKIKERTKHARQKN